MRISVITAGRHGSTHEVGEAIAARLRARGHEARALEAGRRNELGPDAAVVLGSAIYVGRWLKPARKLAERLASEADARPLWLFSVGPVGDPPFRDWQEIERWADQIADELLGGPGAGS